MEWTELTDPDVIRVWKKHGEELAWSYFMGDSTGPVRGGLSFSPDGKYLAAAMGEKIYILDGRSDKVLLSIATSHSINAVAFNPNKNMLAVASDDNISMWRIDAKQNGL
jgi:WD40 repeat protein